MMMSSSPSPGPMADGRFELGSTDVDALGPTAVLGATLGALDDVLGACVAVPPVHAATAMPTLAATANNALDLILLLLLVTRSRSCADASRSGGRLSR